MENVLVDSNLLVYVVDSNEPAKHQKAKILWNAIINNPNRFVISNQNLREFAFVLQNKKKFPLIEIRELTAWVAESFKTILYDNEKDIQTALVLLENSPTDFWDLLLAATMRRHRITTIYTENTKDFKKIPFIKAVNPLQ